MCKLFIHVVLSGRLALSFNTCDCNVLITAYFNDIVVGAVCCREDRSDGHRKLYIMTLGVLAPYRRLKIGQNLKSSFNAVFKEFKSIVVALR